MAEWFYGSRVNMIMSDRKAYFNLDEVQINVISQDDIENASSSLQSVGKSFILKDISRILDGERPPEYGNSFGSCEI
jgi:hypothetical protein